ncbi:MAG: Cation efflux protein [Parcubacteria group bacterium GW2011_GWC1_34_10]|nr:MAG: Cation efflux protein [Parcubacteria group bacterium GW2011_GWC1_34_10]
MKNHTQGKRSVMAALLGNTFVTVMKAIVFFMTGSASMFAESVHSLADTLNQSLLLVGIKRSKKPADHIRGYGYGIERFFWSLVSACGILFIGSGVTVYHSIDSLTHHGEGVQTFNLVSIVVLILALVIEGFTLMVALKELKKNEKFSKEAVGGIIVGLVLGFLAILLIIKNHQYIIGKPLDMEVTEKIIETLEKDPCIEHVVEFKSVAVDIGKYKIFTTVEWNGSPLYEEIYEAGDLKEEFDNIKDDFKEFTKLMLKTTDRIPRLIGNHIDTIEKEIVERFPQVVYVDIEIN